MSNANESTETDVDANEEIRKLKRKVKKLDRRLRKHIDRDAFDAAHEQIPGTEARYPNTKPLKVDVIGLGKLPNPTPPDAPAAKALDLKGCLAKEQARRLQLESENTYLIDRLHEESGARKLLTMDKANLAKRVREESEARDVAEEQVSTLAEALDAKSHDYDVVVEECRLQSARLVDFEDAVSELTADCLRERKEKERQMQAADELRLKVSKLERENDKLAGYKRLTDDDLCPMCRYKRAIDRGDHLAGPLMVAPPTPAGPVFFTYLFRFANTQYATDSLGRAWRWADGDRKWTRCKQYDHPDSKETP